MSNLRLSNFPLSESFDNAFRRLLQPMGFENDAPALNMRIDVTENDTGYAIKADIPGVLKEDIHVRVDGNVVQIDAESRSDKETKDKGGRMLRSERYYGALSRTFSLADDVDEERVEAKYADGVLSLQLPKKAAQKSRSIAVQ
jgi:HSP20 family protein